VSRAICCRNHEIRERITRKRLVSKLRCRT